MTVQELVQLQVKARMTPPMPGSEWPPSMYYRYLGELAAVIKARVFVELGTCGGGCARHVALRNKSCKVITLDIMKLPQVTLAEKQAPNMEFVLGDSSAMAATIGPKYTSQIDLLFIDTVHEYDFALRELNAWKPYLAPGAIVCFDDLYREGMDKLWRDLPGQKTGYNDLREMHIGGLPTDGGFGALIL